MPSGPTRWDTSPLRGMVAASAAHVAAVHRLLRRQVSNRAAPRDRARQNVIEHMLANATRGAIAGQTFAADDSPRWAPQNTRAVAFIA